MAIVLGTNAGFVTTAPTSDPDGNTSNTADFLATATKATSPEGTVKIIEMGWWCRNATEAANFELGIYTHSSGDDNPENLLAGSSQTNAKGTDVGWKVASGLDITLSPETIYWLSVQLDNTSSQTTLDQQISGGKSDNKGSQSTLPDPWGTSSNTSGNITAIYALVETVEPSATDNMTIIGENVY